MSRFDNKVALVSGGARGMGAEAALAFHSEGAAVIVGDVLVDEGMELAASVASDRFTFVRHDVTSRSSWDAAVGLAQKRYGNPTILMNNAAVIDHTPVEQLDEAVFRHVLNVDLVAPLIGMQSVLPGMRREGGGAIINVTSAASLIGMSNSAAYGAAKWGLRGLGKVAALELGADNIRVNAVSPGPTFTVRHEGKVTDEVLGLLAIRRWGQPSDIASMCLFLASDEAAFITGADFPVDGGMSAGLFVPESSERSESPE